MLLVMIEYAKESISQLLPIMKTPHKKVAGIALLLVVFTIGLTSPLLTIFAMLLLPPQVVGDPVLSAGHLAAWRALGQYRLTDRGGDQFQCAADLCREHGHYWLLPCLPGTLTDGVLYEVCPATQYAPGNTTFHYSTNHPAPRLFEFHDPYYDDQQARKTFGKAEPETAMYTISALV